MLTNDWIVFVEMSESLKQFDRRKSNNEQKQNWLKSLEKVFYLHSYLPCDFWSWYDNQVLPTLLPENTKSLRFFRNEKPIAKEDLGRGGRIMLSSFALQDIDLINKFNSFWLLLLLTMITDDVKIPREIIGAVCKPIRKSNEIINIKLELWLEDIQSNVWLNELISFLDNYLKTYYMKENNIQIHYSSFESEFDKRDV